MGINLKKKLKDSIKGTKNLVDDVTPDFLDAGKIGNKTLSGLSKWDNQVSAFPALVGTRGYVDEEGNYQAKRNLWGKDVFSNPASHISAQRKTGALKDREGAISITDAIKTANRAGRSLQEDPDVPQGIKTGVSLAFDPTMYVMPGTAGKIGSKLGPAGRLLQGRFNPAGALLEGTGGVKSTIGLGIGAAAGAEISSRTNNPWDDMILPLIGGGIGVRAGGDAAGGLKNNVIDSDPEVTTVRNNLAKARKEDDLANIFKHKQELEILGAKDTGFPTRSELRAEISDLALKMGDAGAPEMFSLTRKIVEIETILKNYNDLERLHKGVTDTSVVGLADGGANGSEVTSQSIDELKALSDNRYLDPGFINDDNLIYEYQREYDSIRTYSPGSAKSLEAQGRAAQMLEAIQQRGLDPTKDPYDISGKLPPEEPSPIFGEGRNAETSIQQPTGLEDITTETLQSRLSGINNSGLDEQTKKVLRYTIEQELGNRGIQSTLDVANGEKDLTNITSKNKALSDSVRASLADSEEMVAYSQRLLDSAKKKVADGDTFYESIIPDLEAELAKRTAILQESQNKFWSAKAAANAPAVNRPISGTSAKGPLRGFNPEAPKPNGSSQLLDEDGVQSSLGQTDVKIGALTNPRLGNTVDAALGKEDIIKSIRNSDVEPQTAAFAEHFITNIPDKYLNMLRVLFVDANEAANKSGTLGVYAPNANSPFIRLFMDEMAKAESAPTADFFAQGQRTIAHEISHHLQRFVGTKELDDLVKQYQSEVDIHNANQPDLKSLRESKARPATIEGSSYRFKNFNEWFAEKLTDAARSEWVKSLEPNTRNAVQQIIDFVKEAAIAAHGALFGEDINFSSLYNKIRKGELDSTLGDFVKIDNADLPRYGSLIEAMDEYRAAVPSGTEMQTLSELGKVIDDETVTKPKIKPGSGLRKKNVTAQTRVASMPFVKSLTGAVRQNVERVTARTGNYIKVPDLGEASKNYGGNRKTVQWLKRAGRSLNVQVESGRNILSARAQEALKAFDVDKNGMVSINRNGKNVRGVVPSARDVADGMKKVSFYRIVDFANEYALTTAQKEALAEFTKLADSVVAEKALHGMTVPKTQAKQGFFASRGIQINELVTPDSTGRKITNEHMDAREFADPNDFIKAKGRYVNPLSAFTRYAETHFKDIANQTMQDLLDPLALKNRNEGYAIPHEIAPSLQGKTFDKKVAQAIVDQYTGAARLGGASLSFKSPVIRGINSAMLPLKITFDLGAAMINQGGSVYSHPTTWAKNMAITTRDMFDQRAYHQWLQSDDVKDFSAHSGAIHFEPSNVPDLQAHTLIMKGKYNPLRVLAEHFTILNNRMRVDMYKATRDLNRAIGNDLDDTGLEAVARSINRFTGISEGRATDLEQTLMFAPNFFRSQIENIKYALTDGSIDGQMARRYLGNYMAGAGALAYSTAMLQDRNPAEVMSPFDLRKLQEEGVLALNPNFLTVRVMDQDVRLLGPYTTFAGIMMGGAEMAQLSYKDPDGTSRYLEDYLLRLSNTKGAPVTSMAGDLKRGESIVGVKFGTPEWMARQIAPISMGDVVEPGQLDAAIESGDWSQLFSPGEGGQEQSWQQKLFGGFMNFLGGNTNQLSSSELRESRSQYMFNDSFDNLNKEQKTELYKNYPIARDDGDPFTKMYNEIDANEVKFIDGLNEKQALVESGLWTKAEFREWYKTWNQERIVANAQVRETSGQTIIERYGFTGTMDEYLAKPKNLQPEDKAVDDWYKLTGQFAKPEGFDYDGLKAAREKFLNNLDPTIEAYVLRNTKPTDPTGGIVDEMKSAQKKVGTYFEAEKMVYDKLGQSSPLMASFGSPEGIDKFIQTTATKMGLTPATTVAMLEKALPEFKIYNEILREYQRVLRLTDPELDKALTDWYGFEPANRFGYITSQYGSDAGYALNPAIIEDKSVNDRSNAYNFALEAYVAQKGTERKQKRYSLIESNRLSN